MNQIQRMKLTDLGVDCLERIFRYLPIEDLLNLADSNKQLKNTADLVFLLKYSSKIANIVGIAGFQRNDKKMLELGDLISIANPKKVFQLLRCFGNLYPNYTSK